MTTLLTTLTLLAGLSLGAETDEGTIGPWRKGDFAYQPTLTDDRPNEKSRELVGRYYRALAPEKIVTGEKGVLRFRVAPRSVGWAGILVLDKEGQPVPLSAGLNDVILTDLEGKPAHESGWIQHDTQVLYSDASPVAWPKTRIAVRAGRSGKRPSDPITVKPTVDEATLNFSHWRIADSKIKLSALLDGPTSAHGPVAAKDGRFLRDGRPMFFWGGHNNHVPGVNYPARGLSPKATSDSFAEVYGDAGINVFRSIALGEIVADPATGAINPQMLDHYHYLIARLGQQGVYFLVSDAPLHTVWGYPKEQADEVRRAASYHFWCDPQSRAAWKNSLRAILTAPNPYNGKAIKDDRTVIGFELANETGLNERRFDFTQPGNPDFTRKWRSAFNRFLLKKYGSRQALAEAWQRHPLLPHEDPARETIVIPTNYRGARTPYGGTGQHDQWTTGRWYINGKKYGIPAAHNPRIVDAIEFNRSVAKKAYPFDFNNLAAPAESESLRLAFNDFLVQKYGSREALDKAWADDVLFPWETPAVGVDKRSRQPDPKLPQRTIVIPSNYRGQDRYEEDLTSRLADPRVSDTMEFTYQVQRDWATDMARFLKQEIGLKCGVGWNGDTFHVCQGPNHQANLESPLDIGIAAEYLDWDNGDQLTSRLKNLKRFNAYGRIFGRPMFAYEWSMWATQGPYVYEYGLLLALMGRVCGFDGHAHHQLGPYKYPVSDPEYSLRVTYINPLSNRPQRGVAGVSQWILQRSKIAEQPRIIIGMPHHDAFVGGPERKMSNWAFENWLMYQVGTEDYGFGEVYDGPADRIVVHSGHGPYGDYRKAKHAVLWCHANSDREGKDPEAKRKWFAMHGIHFAPGQKYFLNDQFFATTEDMSDYNIVHAKAEQARFALLRENEAKQDAANKATGRKSRITHGDHYYWAAEPGFRPTELDRRLYAAMKQWGFPLPFADDEIDLVWRSSDRTMAMDTRREHFMADRGDFQMWFGRGGPGKTVKLGRLEAKTDEKQYAVALLAWDTADFATAKTLALWTLWNSEVTVKLPLPESVRVYAVNWLGKRVFEVQPISAGRDHVTFATVRHDDVFCWEIER